MNTKIKFGTDGWRALIAKDFTFEAVSLVAQAVAETMQEKMPERKSMVVGYDRRFLSRQFAQTVATVYAKAGYNVLLSQDFLPTPAVSWCAKNEENAVGATMITASHNPPEWNGFKFKEIFGGSALPSTTQAFEKKITSIASKSFLPSENEYEKMIESERIRLFNPMEEYFEAVLGQIQTEIIEKAKLQIALDVMFGAASRHFPELLQRLGVGTFALHEDENPGFLGTPPEPTEKNLPELSRLVREKGLACGLATDGDADRLAAIDEEGNYFNAQQILSVIYWHMLRHRKKAWSIARSVSTTRMVDLIAKRAGQKCLETSVGFKFIAEKMVKGEVQIGGEESGGVGIFEHIPERDGLLTGLLLLEIIATTGKGLKEIYQDLCKEERPYHFIRLDLHITSQQMEAALHRLRESPPEKWDQREVDRLDTFDGFKFYMKDGSWLLIRPSGTEPIFRLYADTESREASEKMVHAAREFVVGK